MATTIGTEYDHIDITNGVGTIRHPLKDASAREMVGDVVKVQDTQPASSNNVIWVKETPENEIEVPTYEEFEELSDSVSDLKSAIINLTPKNFKETLTVLDLKEGYTLIENTKAGNYNSTTYAINFSTQANSYLVKIDLSVINKGKIYGNAYTPSYTGTARAFYVAGGANGEYYLAYSRPWNALSAAIPDFLTVNGDGSWIVDLETCASYTKATIGNATYLYMWSETQNPQIFYFDGEAALPSWFPSVHVPSLVLPTDSYAVVGHEWNMYYDNIVDGLTDDYYVFCSGIVGQSYDRFLRFTPTANDAGNKTITVYLIRKADNQVIEKGAFILHISADVSPTKKVIFIGDSLTDAGIYPHEIQFNLSNGNITSVGTRTATVSGQDVKHEGRSGWSAVNYVSQASSASGVVNAFWNPSTSKFDFSYYMAQNSFSGIDCVMLNLGTNGVSNIDGNISAINEMITSIHNYDSNIKIIVSLITPPATQDGCGHHTNMFNANEWKHNELALIRAYLENYNGKITNVFVSEPYYNIDRLYDFNTVTIPVSSRNPASFICQNNNVHPSNYGYLKMADVYYANLVARLS